MPQVDSTSALDMTYVEDMRGVKSQPFDETKLKKILVWNNVRSFDVTLEF